LYQDASWAFLRLGQGKLALVSPSQHPPHVALRVSTRELERAGKPIDRHRDGTTGIYVDDPQGNVIELICYPVGETVYASAWKRTGRCRRSMNLGRRVAVKALSQA